MKIPYPIVSKTSPFFYLNISGIDLTTIVTTGATQLQVYRVWKNTECEDTVPSADVPINPVNYAPIDQKKNKFTFVFDSSLFNMDGGRYRADFYYKGTYVVSVYLIYSKPEIMAVGSANV